MTYEEAVILLARESGLAHEPRCFEVGDCDADKAAEYARAKLRREMQTRREAINQAEKAVAAHVKEYDREQVIPRTA
jgi:hypothetical protein